MFKLNYKNFNHIAIILFNLSILSIFFEISNINKILWILAILIVLFFKLTKVKYKKILTALLAIILIYLQLKLDNYILSKEFFLNTLIILLVLKYLELENKQGHYFFNYTCIFIAIASLIYGQDLISSFTSTLIITFSILHLYLLNQTEILTINFKSLIKLLSLSMITIPFIIIIYLIFPRQEISIDILPSQKNTLGIPDKIQLGTFDRVSNSSKKIFTYKNDLAIKEKLYFRVKIFDILDNKKDWISSKNEKFSNKYKKKIIPLNGNQQKYKGILILEPHNKKWVPSLKNTKIIDNITKFNDLNLTFSSSSKIINKEVYTSTYFASKIHLKNDLQKFYTLLPNTLNNDLINWASQTFANSKDNEDYIKKILKKFSSGKYYYTLKPANIGNNYSKFFLETKEGYCEYYAGTLAILARIVGIPTRIIAGYYGGKYNEYGDFYSFTQSDAHAWIEIWNENKGWIRIDPTAYIPQQNIKDSNNSQFDNIQNSINNNSFLFQTFNKIFNYARYLDYKWTNTFIQYNQNSRKILLKKFINKNYFFDNFKDMTLIVLGFIFIFLLYKILFNKKILYYLLIHKIKREGIAIESYHVHQDIFKMLNLSDQKKLNNIFQFYEKITFHNMETKIIERFLINIRILKYYFF